MRTLPKKLGEKIESLVADLQDAATEIRDYMADRSEKWQESDRADSYDTWANSLESAAEALEQITEGPQ